MVKKNKANNKIIIYGAGQLAKLVFNILKKKKLYKVIGFIENNSSLIGKSLLGEKIFSEQYCDRNFKNIKNRFIAIGDIKSRKKIIKKLKNKKLNFPKIIDSSSNVYDEKKIGSGTIVLPSATILNDTKIDKHCVIGTGVNILHNTELSENCVIGGGTTVGSNIKIEKNVLVGVGSVLASKKIKVGQNSIVCSGSVVLRDIKKNSKVIGNPAKNIPLK